VSEASGEKPSWDVRLYAGFLFWIAGCLLLSGLLGAMGLLRRAFLWAWE
jgi:hypothetical protein